MSDKVFKNDTMLPCDYCGGERSVDEIFPEHGRYFVNCNGGMGIPCDAYWPEMETKAEAIEVANRNCWRIVAKDGMPEERGAYLVQFKGGQLSKPSSTPSWSRSPPS